MVDVFLQDSGGICKYSEIFNVVYVCTVQTPLLSHLKSLLGTTPPSPLTNLMTLQVLTRYQYLHIRERHEQSHSL